MAKSEDCKEELADIGENFQKLHLSDAVTGKLFAKIEKLEAELDQKDKVIDKLQSELKISREKITTMQEQLETEKQAVANSKLIASPKAKNDKLNHSLVILEKNAEKELFPYYVIRRQKISLQDAINRQNEKYPSAVKIFEKVDDPNSIKLYNLIKQELNVQFHGNHLKTSLSKEELLDQINKLYNKILQI